MTGASFSILLALWVQGGLALVLLWVLGTRRLPLIARKEVAVKDIALERNGWPEEAKKASNAFDNQFQLPLLLYVAGGAAIYLGATLIEVILIWLFVATRLVHAYIHVTTNHVYHRFYAYAAGYGLLVALWLVLGIRLVLTLGAN